MGDSLLWLFLIDYLEYVFRIRVVMDIPSITAALQGLVAAKHLFSGYVDREHDADNLAKINKALESVSDAQEVVYSLRDELFKLQDENQRLKLNAQKNQDWVEKIAEYSLTETLGGAIVYESSSPPHHYICPSCFESQNLQILQDKRVVSGIFECSACKSIFGVKRPKRM